MSSPHSIHIDFDGAWPKDSTEAYLDCRSWEQGLRYSATRDGMEKFYEFIRDKGAPFTLFGSGDYHHLSALWLRRFEDPVTLVSFDNHPDWDTRPPHWCCGTWINRAIQLPYVRKAAIWGCGNFELDWPSSWFVNRTALRADRLEIWPWTERLSPYARKRWPGMTAGDWRENFSKFARRHAGQKIYVTVDIDCLDKSESITNWENGLFKADDVRWAIEELRSQAEIVGGDLCGAYTKPSFERFKQRIEATLDRPKLGEISMAEATARNVASREVIWNALVAP